MTEKRKYNRVQIVNDLSYVVLDKSGKTLEKGKGKTLDISQGGLRMQTKRPIGTKYFLLIIIDMNNKFTIKGHVVYCIEKIPNTFLIGIRFMDDIEKIRASIVDMVKLYNKQKRLLNGLSKESGKRRLFY
jgi:c-di-GMP-binding flagellar brake protein YcgR